MVSTPQNGRSGRLDPRTGPRLAPGAGRGRPARPRPAGPTGGPHGVQKRSKMTFPRNVPGPSGVTLVMFWDHPGPVSVRLGPTRARFDRIWPAQAPIGLPGPAERGSTRGQKMVKNDFSQKCSRTFGGPCGDVLGPPRTRFGPIRSQWGLFRPDLARPGCHRATPAGRPGVRTGTIPGPFGPFRTCGGHFGGIHLGSPGRRRGRVGQKEEKGKEKAEGLYWAPPPRPV
jgi:hypothetical protein